MTTTKITRAEARRRINGTQLGFVDVISFHPLKDVLKILEMNKERIHFEKLNKGYITLRSNSFYRELEDGTKSYYTHRKGEEWYSVDNKFLIVYTETPPDYRRSNYDKTLYTAIIYMMKGE